MLSKVVIAFSLCCLLSLVYCQPAGAPTPTVFLNNGNRINSWIWPTVSYAALIPGVTYTLGTNFTSYYANITFTVNAGCSTGYNAAGPTGNQGWRYTVVTADSTHELPATPVTGVNVWTGPTQFGTTRASKISWLFDYIDVCSCIFVNYISFTSYDSITTYKAHFWNGAVVKRDVNATVYKPKRQGPPSGSYTGTGVCQGCSPATLYPTHCVEMTTGGTSWHVYQCNTNVNNCDCGTTVSVGAAAVSQSFVMDPNGLSGQGLAKRQNTLNMFWIDVEQEACQGLPTLGSYGRGATGSSVLASSALGVTYS